ncbi:hypothetical protein [Spirosoma agri]|uniref:Uncharacterized protein n=1 Tax=Spirosoma agri TaxID=1987381 RepID=A0A6M0ICW9_9BACT|nr:hypothetical protein [Spirosoma agri]NEU65968.1 hypothetical protein [Spirosoma agri]
MAWTSNQQHQLLSLVNQRNERERLTRFLADAEAVQTSQLAKLAMLTDQLSQEQRDVDQLTGLSWRTIYYTILQRKQEQLTNEEAEVAQLELAYGTATDELQQTRQLIETYSQKLTAYASVDRDYEALMAQKRAVIQLRWDSIGRQYDQLVADVEAADRQFIEAQQAFRAGRLALDELYKTNTMLMDAQHIGYLDLVGLTLASYAKLKKLDDVRAQTFALQQALYQFQREYADLGYELRREVHITGWYLIGDAFFDNAFSDRITQTRIENALDASEEVRQILIPVVNQLANQIGPFKDALATKSLALQTFLEEV